MGQDPNQPPYSGQYGQPGGVPPQSNYQGGYQQQGPIRPHHRGVIHPHQILDTSISSRLMVSLALGHNIIQAIPTARPRQVWTPIQLRV